VPLGVRSPHSHPQRRLERQMLVTKALVSYRCRKCSIKYLIRIRPLPVKLNKLAGAINTSRLCGACGGPMIVEQSIFSIIKDECGNDKYGTWQCIRHPGYVYYPSLVRKAKRQRKTISVGIAYHHMAEKYSKMVSSGYPWRCPVCGTFLIYMDSRDHVEAK